MRLNRRKSLLLLLALVALSLTWLAWPRRCPVELKLAGLEPEDSGGKSSLLTLSISNRDYVTIMFEDGAGFEARISNQWVEVPQRFSIPQIGSGGTKQLRLAVPTGASACRLRLNYQTQIWKERLMVKLGLSGRRLVAKSSWLRKLVWPDEMKTMPMPPLWKPVIFEMALPKTGGPTN